MIPVYFNKNILIVIEILLNIILNDNINDKWLLIYMMTPWEMGSRPSCNGDPVCQEILENTEKDQQTP